MAAMMDDMMNYGAAGGGGGRHPSKFEEKRHTWKIEEDTRGGQTYTWHNCWREPLA